MNIFKTVTVALWLEYKHVLWVTQDHFLHPAEMKGQTEPLSKMNKKPILDKEHFNRDEFKISYRIALNH